MTACPSSLTSCLCLRPILLDVLGLRLQLSVLSSACARIKEKGSDGESFKDVNDMGLVRLYWGPTPKLFRASALTALLGSLTTVRDVAFLSAMVRVITMMTL